MAIKWLVHLIRREKTSLNPSTFTQSFRILTLIFSSFHFLNLLSCRIMETLKATDPESFQMDKFKNEQLLCLTINLLLFIRSQVPVTKKLFQSCKTPIYHLFFLKLYQVLMFLLLSGFNFVFFFVYCNDTLLCCLVFLSQMPKRWF